jgi:hypothetical protein
MWRKVGLPVTIGRCFPIKVCPDNLIEQKNAVQMTAQTTELLKEGMGPAEDDTNFKIHSDIMLKPFVYFLAKNCKRNIPAYSDLKLCKILSLFVYILITFIITNVFIA